MEEKERYIIGKGENISIVDNDQKAIFNITTKKLQDLLNQQDKEIKELKDYTENTANLIDKLTEDSVSASKQLAIEELEKLKENAWQSATDISQLIDYTELAKIIDNQIKELGGEENE